MNKKKRVQNLPQQMKVCDRSLIKDSQNEECLHSPNRCGRFCTHRVCRNEGQGSTILPFMYLSLWNGWTLSFIVTGSVHSVSQ